jgi:hypothetical protein
MTALVRRQRLFRLEKNQREFWMGPEGHRRGRAYNATADNGDVVLMVAHTSPW